ncbi:MAG: hypothetical protein J6L62_00565 [Clostridia bacterium]|nr:hypothetical protein [Clostridia bacterium]
MELRKLYEKIKYPLVPFAVLAALSLVYDGFKTPVILVLRLLVCIIASVFFARFVSDSKSIYLPAFVFLSLISCNVIFLTNDVHILLSLAFFLISLACNGKFRVLSPVFAGLCVITQPLTVLFFVPSIIGTLLIKKEKILSLISTVVSAGAFLLTKLLADTEFFADQFSSYHLSVHLVHFSTTHTEFLTSFTSASLPLIAVLIFFIVSFVIKKKFLAAASLVISAVLGLWGFAMSENPHTVFFVILPLLCSVLSVCKSDGYAEICDTFNSFFKKHLLLFLLSIAFTAGFPLIFGQPPLDSAFFSRSTFIIFRQE